MSSPFFDSTQPWGRGPLRAGSALLVLTALACVALGGQAQQVQTVTFTSSVQASYAVIVTKPDGSAYTATFTPSASATTLALCAAEFETWVREHAPGGWWSSSVASAVVTLTTRIKGLSYTIASATEMTAAQTTAAATPADLYPGRVVIRTAAGADGSQSGASVKHPVTSDFTAQAATFTFASLTTGDTARIYGTFRGQPFDAQVAYATGNPETTTALQVKLDAHLNTRFGAGTGLVATNPSNGVIVLTAEAEGDEFEAFASTVGTGTVAVTGAPSPTASTSLMRKLFGVLQDEGAEYDSTVLADVIRGGRSAQALRRGDIPTPISATVTPNDPVYVGVGASEAGKLFNALAADRVWVPPSVMRWQAHAASSDFINTQNLAVIGVTL